MSCEQSRTSAPVPLDESRTIAPYTCYGPYTYVRPPTIWAYCSKHGIFNCWTCWR